MTGTSPDPGPHPGPQLDPHPDCALAPEDVEREYSPSSMVGGSSAPFVAEYVSRSEAATFELGDTVQVLADGGRLVLSVVPDAPLFVFVHGGYWQALSAEHSVFLAPEFLARGWSYGAVEYTIAPEGTVERMIGEVRDGLASLVAAAGSPSRIVVAGHSAGAHLVAMVALAAAPPVDVEHVVLVSGVFDLRPVQAMSVNDALGWSAEQAVALSPALRAVETGGSTGVGRVTLLWGGRDTAAFGRQSRSYATQVRAAGIVVTEDERPERHHFDILDDLPALVAGTVAD